MEGVTPMVLAAGHATRLRPLTSSLAKAVVPFLNRPLLDHTLEWLARSGFERVVINLHHAGETIRERYGDAAFGLRVDYSVEHELLGSGGGPRHALELLGDRVLLVNGDVVGLQSIGALLRHHQQSGALATLALYRGAAAAGYPQVTAAATGELLAFPGDAPGQLPADAVRGVFTGLHVIEQRLLEQIPAGTKCGIVDPVYREALAGGLPLHAVVVPGTWYEVGDPQRYIDNQLASLRLGDVPLGIAGQFAMADGGYASVEGQLGPTYPVPPYLVGPDVRIAHGTRLEGVVLGARSLIAPSHLRRVVTWPESRIGARSSLANVVVMAGVEVPADTVAENVVFTAEGAVSFAANGQGTAP